MSHSAATSPRRIVEKNPLDDPSLLRGVNQPTSLANQPATLKSDGKGSSSPAHENSEGDIVVDLETFQQILDLDDDAESREFSGSMAQDYCEQARSTCAEMEAAFKEKDLIKLSSLGHFLKGSSAALGVKKVQASCERMQHYGNCRDEERNIDLTQSQALENIDKLLNEVELESVEAERWLVEFYTASGVPLIIATDKSYGRVAKD